MNGLAGLEYLTKVMQNELPHAPMYEIANCIELIKTFEH